ncbi:MAG: response regulator transcription factor [Chlorobi bacterium]|nr:response regulator transcription factor [Chlorobiota bacterium]
MFPKILRFIILEKNKDFRLSLKTILNQIEYFEVVADFDDFDSFIFKDKLKFNSILLDLNIGTYKCVEFIKKMKEYSQDIKIILLSDFKELIYSEAAVRAGAEGVIFKSSDKSIFEKKIRQFTAFSE